ncbi:MAG TPA: T6SS immunity protein Tdi1 domain-containing protein [Hymenobacter sp.]|uniref:T6SS immunity protein Tdi1 domain-containing protein n=1 Tax=Hymenobacter sp. TaxID=1898978 RepID=UPI002D80C1D4|nr:T6SS immunity protein Tdi1 domain-containing protein [Hymenobacter sp.]HET9505145.1 T6SS immunity protein Tdi1 domain-containing protein [Hymenobacter sp.]
MFTKLLAHFPEYTIHAKPTPELLARYGPLVPPEMLVVWQEYGFGTFRNGYLKVVNPDEFNELLADTYQLVSTPAAAAPIVLFATAMGDLLIWEDGFLIRIDYRHGETEIIGRNLTLFFKNHVDDFNPQQRLRWEPYPAARARLGEPTFDECFGYVPLLALGGPETVDHLQKVKLREHLYLISQFTGVLER